MQTKAASAVEVVCNQLAGIVVGWLVTYAILPTLSDMDRGHAATFATAIFFVTSSIRMFILRRVFNRRTRESESVD